MLKIKFLKSCFLLGFILFSMVFPNLSFAQIYDPSPADIDTRLIADEDSRNTCNSSQTCTPLILIHGIHGTSDLLNASNEYWLNLLNYIYSNGLNANYKIYRFHYLSDIHSVWEIARALRNKIDDFTDTGTFASNKQFIIVAHSMGGLVARSYMNEHDHYSPNAPNYLNKRGGERVLKLITLATPHHGSPVANKETRFSESWIPYYWDWHDWSNNFDDPIYWAIVSKCEECFVNPQSENRATLRWDNYDSLWGNEYWNNSYERNDWLINLNNMPFYDNKIIAYYGWIGNDAWVSSYGAMCGATGPYEFHTALIAQKSIGTDNHDLLKILGVLLERMMLRDVSSSINTIYNDGMVPVQSAYFKDHTVAKKIGCPGYDHEYMKDGGLGNCSTNLPLFDSVKNDLIKIWKDYFGDLKGAVEDQNGPVSNAKVELYGPHFGVFATTYTDESGNFSFEDLSEASYYVKVSKTGYNTATLNSITVYQGVTSTIPTIYLTVSSATSTGTLSITTTHVSGAIYVDSVYKGTGSWSGSVSSGSYAVTFGSVSGYNTPPLQTAVVSGGQTTTITGTYTAAGSPVISGYISTSGGSSIEGVAVVFSNNGGTVYTDQNGLYTKTVSSGWSGTVTPLKSYYTFSPPKAYSNVTSSQSNQNYTGTEITPVIGLSSPNGGEDWQKGTSYNITWSSQGNVGAYVKIELYKGGTLNYTITSSTANDNSYPWTVPDLLATGSDYKIKVTSTSSSSYSDESNNYFSISPGLTDFKTYYYWDFDTDGTEGWTPRNSTDEGIYSSEYWIINPTPDTASKSGAVSPDNLTAINTNTYNSVEVRAAVKNTFVSSLDAYFKINNQWMGPKKLNYISGTQQANSQCIYKGTIDYTGQIQQVRVDFVWGSDSVDDRVYIDYVKFTNWSDTTNPSVTIGSPYLGESVVVNTLKTIQFYATDNTVVSSIDVKYSNDGGSSYSSISGCTGLAGTSQTCTWTPTSTTNNAVIKVIAYDSSGNSGEMTVSFKVVSSVTCTASPTTPNLYDPGNYTESNYIVLNWQKVSTATSYILEESTSSNFTNATQYTYTGADTTTATLTNKANNTYYYHLKAKNDCGESWWSSWVDMEVRVNSAPYTPSNPNPSNGASNVSRTLTLSWSGGDSDGIADYYLGFGTSTDNMTFGQGFGSTNAYNTTYTVPFTLEPATTYYWHVKAKDDHGVITEGPIWSFTTVYEYPDLVPTAFTVTGDVKNGSTVTASVTVKNQGNYPSLGCQLLFFYSNTLNGEDNKFSYDTNIIPALNAGESVTIIETLQLKNLSAGTSYLVAKIDTNTYFTEKETSNNKMSYIVNYTDTSDPNIPTFEMRWANNGTYKTNQNVQFVYEVFDDIGVSGVDFYYSTDNGTTWNSVASNIAIYNNGYGNSYEWTIPSNTPMNNTFKAKIVGKDTTGNSTPMVIGPFTIIDGSAPSVTVTAPVSGDVWDLGSTHDISWTATSPNGIASIDLWFYYGTSSDKIASLTTNSGTYSWTLPTSGYYATNDGKIKISITDGNGNTAEAYGAIFIARDASQPPPAPWTTPERITPDGANGSRSGAVAVDASGNLHFVYGYLGDNSIYYKKKTSSGWSVPVKINGSDGQSPFDLTISVDSGNNPHISWLNGRPGDVYYSYYNGYSWTSPASISGGVTADSLDMELDSMDNVHFVWNRAASGNPVYHRMRYSNGAWADASTIQGLSGVWEGSLSRGISGVMHLVCSIYSTGQESLYYSKWDGTQWSSPTIAVTETGNRNYYIDTASDNNGLYVVYDVYGRFGGDWEHRIKYASYDGLGWSASEFVSDSANGYGKVPTVTVNSNGNPQVVWYEAHQDGARILYKQKTSLGWSNAIQVNTEGNVPEGSYPQYIVRSAISNTDDLHVIWTSNYSGHEEIFYNYADVSEDFVSPSATITTPTTGENLSAGTTYNITWVASDNVSVSDIELKYSTDGGNTFTGIANNLTNTGSYSWTVPDISSDNVQVFIVATDSSGNKTMVNSGILKIVDLSGPSIAITSPEGGELWDGGTTQNITWQASDSNGVSSVNIYYSTDDGTTWFTESTGEMNDGSYSWIVPQTASNNFRIKLIAVDVNGNSASVISNAFSIKIANNPPSAPNSPIPLDGTVLDNSSVSLQWQCSDPDGDVLSYDVYFGTTNPPPLVASAQTTNSYIPSISNNMTYYWKIVASDGKTTTSGSVWSFTTSEVVNAPTNLSATHTSASQINLSWTDNSSNEDGFKVERKTGSNGTYNEIASVSANTTSYTDAGLSGHTEFIYRIRAYKGSNYSGYSNEAAAVTANNPPNQPLLVSPSNNAAGQPLLVTLSWTGSDLDGDSVTYDVYFGTTTNPSLVSTAQAASNYSVSQLSYNTIYYWKIVAKDTSNAATESALWSFVTQSEDIPSAPTNLALNVISSNQVDLTWTDNSNNELGFKVERKQGDANIYTQIGITTASLYSDTTITSGNTYYYRVRAYNNSGDSSYSNIVSYSPVEIDTQPPVTSITPQGSTYSSTQYVTLTCSDSNGSGCAATYFTIDGNTPTTSSSVYSGEIPVSANTTLKFFSVDNAGNSESVKTETYTLFNTVIINKSGTGSGTVTSFDGLISCGSDCSETYSSGTSVTLTATADTGSTFAGWSGDCDSNGQVTMNANKTCTATFAGIPNISASPASLNFGNVNVGVTSPSQTVTVTNTGTANLSISAVTLTGTNSSEYTKQVDACAGNSLPPSQSCQIQIAFSPASAGAKTAGLAITSNDPDTSTLNIPLSGTGIQQSIQSEVEVVLSCQTNVTAGNALTVTVKLYNYDCTNSISVNRLMMQLMGNSSGTLLGLGIWGPYNKSIATKTVSAATCDEFGNVTTPGTATPFSITIINPVPTSLSGKMSEVTVDAITSKGESIGSGSCFVNVTGAQ